MLIYIVCPYPWYKLANSQDCKVVQKGEGTDWVGDEESMSFTSWDHWDKDANIFHITTGNANGYYLPWVELAGLRTMKIYMEKNDEKNYNVKIDNIV